MNDDEYDEYDITPFDVMDAVFSAAVVEHHTLIFTDCGSFAVSTVWTSDMGFETAILDHVVHPVERYLTEDGAMVGHAKWVEFAKSGQMTITQLGWKKFPSKVVTLVPVKGSQE